MAVFDLFSKRLKRARGEVPDVYIYKDLPRPLRVQIVYIVRDAFLGIFGYSHADEAYRRINNALRREYGCFRLIENADSEEVDGQAVLNFFLQEKTVERALDVVEQCFKVIQDQVGKGLLPRNPADIKSIAEEAVAELNARFKEHGVGYQYESGQIIRVDYQFIHAEAVKPALDVLRDKKFRGANEEFLNAYKHYQHGRYKECLVDALKAFESTLKTICNLRGWPIKPTDTAKHLIDTCMDNGLFPRYLESQFSSLRSLLESGVPVIRNKNGGHGQGVSPVAVPEYMARYALNLTATTILFIFEVHKS